MTTAGHKSSYGKQLLTQEDMNILREMLGVQPHIQPDKWGCQNYFRPNAFGTDDESLERLRVNGMARRGLEKVNGLWYYHATIAGCRAIGLTDEQMARALYPNIQELRHVVENLR